MEGTKYSLELLNLKNSTEYYRDSMVHWEFSDSQTKEFILSEILAGEYDSVIFYCSSKNLEKTLELLLDLKTAQPRIAAVMAGREITQDAMNFMKTYKFVDFLVTGEGEFTFSKLIQYFNENNDKFHNIRGLSYRQAGKVVVNRDAPTLVIESLQFPYRDMYIEDSEVLYYETSRGNFFSSSYLPLINRKRTMLPLDRVLTELRYLSSCNAKKIEVIDDIFNWNRERAYSVFFYLINIGSNEKTYKFNIHPSYLDRNTIKLLGESKKDMFELVAPILSLNEEALYSVNRSMKIDHVITKLREISENTKVNLVVELMIGLPFDTFKSFQETFNRVYNIGPSNIKIDRLEIFPSSEMYRNMGLYDYVFTRKPPYTVLANKFISSRELNKLSRFKKIIDYYYNDGYFDNTVKYLIKKTSKTPFQLFLGLSEFFYLKGYQYQTVKKELAYRAFYQYLIYIGRLEDGLEYLEQDLKKGLTTEAQNRFNKKGWLEEDVQ